MSVSPDIYERHDLCNDLAPAVMCFRSKTYANGEHTNELHEHVPAHRISQEDAVSTLRSLVARFAGWSGESIIHSNLNARSGGPDCSPGFVHRITYPQPGVLRHYVSSGNTQAWFDKVISPEQFGSGA